MMPLGQTRRDDLVTHVDWKRNIDQPLPVNMTDFSFAKAKFRTTKAVRMLRDARPTRSHGPNAFGIRHESNLDPPPGFVCREQGAKKAKIVTMPTMSVSLHLQADIGIVAETLEPLLWPDMSAILVPRDGWIDVYAEQLSEDIDDIFELEIPLLTVTDAVYVVIRSDQIKVFKCASGQLLATQTPFNLEHITDFETLEQDRPPDAIYLERDASKPGLAEFFGRSTDE